MWRHQPISTSQYQSILSAWQEGIAEAAHSPELMRQVERQGGKLLPRFAEHYLKLRALPRRVRRAVQSKWKHTLAGVALMMALGGAPAMAATINVGVGCTLVNAITTANTDTNTGGCIRVGAAGADTIVLPANSTQTLTAVNTNFLGGPTGLPVIASKITIDGNGSTIRRMSGSPNFRILAVNSSGNLTLQETTVSGGKTSGDSPHGGGVHNRGTLTVTSSTISGNSIASGYDAYGGGVYNSGTLTVINSTISGNSNLGNFSAGGGVYNSGTLTVINSTISRNSASGYRTYGGGVFNGGNLTLTRTIISGNTRFSLSSTREVGSYSGTVNANNFNLFGHDGDDGVSGFIPGATDIVPAVGVSAILNTTLKNSGGRTRTHALVLGSPAIDAVATDCPPPATDQRGVTRPRGTGCDIGAVEVVRCSGLITTKVGTMGNDVIQGTAGNDVIHGLAGDDTINGLGGNDVICGGNGFDTLNGNLGNDILNGQQDSDTLNGGQNTDTCNGGPGIDTAENCETFLE